MTVAEVRNMIDEVDENKDGRLDYGEVFTAFLHSYVISLSSLQIIQYIGDVHEWKHKIRTVILQYDSPIKKYI